MSNYFNLTPKQKYQLSYILEGYLHRHKNLGDRAQIFSEDLIIDKAISIGLDAMQKATNDLVADPKSDQPNLY